MKYPKITLATFWDFVEKTESCWLWLGPMPAGPVSKRYGKFYEGRKARPATQVAWELVNGKPFPVGMLACHKCDNPPCVRPDHIFPGTARDNAIDASKKGRLVRPICKRGHALTPDNVRISSRGRYCKECIKLHNANRVWVYGAYKYIRIEDRAALTGTEE